MTISLSGASGITLPYGATQSTGAGPAFSAYLGSSQTVTSGTYTKLNINTKVFDTNTNYDATTNYRFTPTVAGYYMVSATCYGGGSTSTTNVVSALYKNGSVYLTGSYVNASANPQSNQASAVSSLVYLNGSTDYLEFWGQITGAGTCSFSSGAANTQFNACLIRGQ